MNVVCRRDIVGYTFEFEFKFGKLNQLSKNSLGKIQK